MWTLDRLAGLPLWRMDSEPGHAVAAFTTRRGGVSLPPYASLNVGRSTSDRPEVVEENRARVLAALGLDPARLATAGQVHGDAVTEALAPGHAAGCDALVTREAGLAVAVTTADCLPLIYLSPRAVAVAHSGWRGTAAGIPAATLRRLEALGVPPRDVEVHLGPCIRACCYEVGPEVAERFPADCATRSGGRFRLDLPRAARRLLLEQGVPASSIHDTGACTACDGDTYFSHRRDGSPSGRMWAIAARRG
jgi:hypothetical protein